MRLLALSALGAFAVDQLSKLAVIHLIELPLRGELPVLPPLLVLRMGWNRGVNFGLLAADAELARWALVALAVGISGLVLFWAWRDRGRPVAQVSAGLLIGGALGNALDRVVHGAVADFLNTSCCGIDNPFVFNLADVAIAVGALGLAFFAGGGDGEGRQRSRPVTRAPSKAMDGATGPGRRRAR